MNDYDKIEVVAFDADDTLWVNEPFFRESERRFCSLVAPWAAADEAVERLYGREVANMPLYGYGVKACVLSMVETALELGGETLPAEVVRGIVALGRDQLQRPVELLPGVRETLRRLQSRYRLAVVTKGDLLDQRRKLRLSGLAPCFDAVEVMADKDEASYGEVMRRLGVAPGPSSWWATRCGRTCCPCWRWAAGRSISPSRRRGATRRLHPRSVRSTIYRRSAPSPNSPRCWGAEPGRRCFLSFPESKKEAERSIGGLLRFVS